MVKISRLIDEFEKWAPLSLAAEWDNSGWQVFLGDQEVTMVTIALSLTEAVLQQAIEVKSNFIFTHHPLIFKPLKNIAHHVYPGNLIHKLIKNDIGLYAAHTNLDVVENGISDILAKKLELQEITPLVKTASETVGFGRVGRLDEKLPLHYFVQYLKKVLHTEHVNVINPIDLKIVETVAVCGGSGGDFIKHAGCANVYITGDIKYHPALETENTVVIDAGHYYTERPGLEAVQQFFEKLGIQAVIVNESAPWIIS